MSYEIKIRLKSNNEVLDVLVVSYSTNKETALQNYCNNMGYLRGEVYA